MLGIFEDERRGNRPISQNPAGTGRIFPPDALRLLEIEPLLLHNRAFLAEKFAPTGNAR